MAALANASPGGGHSGGAPGRIVAILTAKEAFVKSQSSATPAQLAQFLRGMRDECLPLVRSCPPEVTRQLTKGFHFGAFMRGIYGRNGRIPNPLLHRLICLPSSVHLWMPLHSCIRSNLPFKTKMNFYIWQWAGT